MTDWTDSCLWWNRLLSIETIFDRTDLHSLILSRISEFEQYTYIWKFFSHDYISLTIQKMASLTQKVHCEHNSCWVLLVKRFWFSSSRNGTISLKFTSHSEANLALLCVLSNLFWLCWNLWKYFFSDIVVCSIALEVSQVICLK